MICTHHEDDADGEAVTEREREREQISKSKRKEGKSRWQEWNKSRSSRRGEFATAADVFLFFIYFYFFLILSTKLAERVCSHICVLLGLCVAGVYSEPGLERPQVSAAAVLSDPENRGQGARYPAVQVRPRRARGRQCDASCLELALVLKHETLIQMPRVTLCLRRGWYEVCSVLLW